MHLGTSVLTLNAGIQETVRRDSLSPVDMNQNLFRQFVYLSTSSFFNMVSVNGYAIREAGPFTESTQHSRELAGSLNFRVGRPWGKTALVTGWGASDEQFSPVISEDYYTSAYVGIERRVSERLSFTAIAEDLRAWRVFGGTDAIAQAIRPAGRVQFSPTRNWSVEASAAYSRNMSAHVYDAVQSGFAISYAMPIHRAFKDAGSEVAATGDFFQFHGRADGAVQALSAHHFILNFVLDFVLDYVLRSEFDENLSSYGISSQRAPVE